MLKAIERLGHYTIFERAVDLYELWRVDRDGKRVGLVERFMTYTDALHYAQQLGHE
jgi:hypothetical protein